MAQTAQNVAIAKPRTAAGALFWAPVGTTGIEADPTTALPSACRSAGYVNADGFTYALNSNTGDDVVVFGGDTPVSGATTMAPTLNFKLVETTGNADALALAFHPDDISSASSTVNGYKASGKAPVDKVLILEFALKGSRVQRFVFGHTSFSTQGDFVINNSDPTNFDITYKVAKDETGDYYSTEWADVA